jgi:hypothetical protein
MRIEMEVTVNVTTLIEEVDTKASDLGLTPEPVRQMWSNRPCLLVRRFSSRSWREPRVRPLQCLVNRGRGRSQATLEIVVLALVSVQRNKARRNPNNLAAQRLHSVPTSSRCSNKLTKSISLVMPMLTLLLLLLLLMRLRTTARDDIAKRCVVLLPSTMSKNHPLQNL